MPLRRRIRPALPEARVQCDELRPFIDQGKEVLATDYREAADAPAADREHRRHGSDELAEDEPPTAAHRVPDDRPWSPGP